MDFSSDHLGFNMRSLTICFGAEQSPWSPSVFTRWAPRCHSSKKGPGDEPLPPAPPHLLLIFLIARALPSLNPGQGMLPVVVCLAGFGGGTPDLGIFPVGHCCHGLSCSTFSSTARGPCEELQSPLHSPAQRGLLTFEIYRNAG